MGISSKNELICDYSADCANEILSTYLISLGQELKKAIRIHSDCAYRPELIVGRSEILDIEDVQNITNNFLGKTQWSRIYSTSLHTRSLEGMYSRLAEIYSTDSSSPVLILVKDTEKRVYGALISGILRQSEEVYELENSIIFRCRPKEDVPNIRATKCRILSQNECLSIMQIGSKGELWLNSELTEGRTGEDCLALGSHNFDETPSRSPLSISIRPTPVVPQAMVHQTSTFRVKNVECWTFWNEELGPCNLMEDFSTFPSEYFV